MLQYPAVRVRTDLMLAKARIAALSTRLDDTVRRADRHQASRDTRPAAHAQAECERLQQAQVALQDKYERSLQELREGQEAELASRAAQATARSAAEQIKEQVCGTSCGWSYLGCGLTVQGRQLLVWETGLQQEEARLGMWHERLTAAAQVAHGWWRFLPVDAAIAEPTGPGRACGGPARARGTDRPHTGASAQPAITNLLAKLAGSRARQPRPAVQPYTALQSRRQQSRTHHGRCGAA